MLKWNDQIKGAGVMKIFLVAFTLTVGMLSAGALSQKIGAISHTTSGVNKAGVTAVCDRMDGDGNVTGSTQHEINLMGKRMVVFKKILNNKRRFLVFYFPSSPESSIMGAREAAEKLGVELVERPVKSVAELKTELGSMKTEEVDGIFQIPDGWVNQHMDLVFRAASRKKIPTITLGRAQITKGALMSYWSESYRCVLRAGAPTDKLLATASAQDLPLKQIERFYLAINLQTAREIGFTFSQRVLKRADLVVG